MDIYYGMGFGLKKELTEKNISINIMMSFEQFQNSKKELNRPKNINKLFMDSGAFSNDTKGTYISINDYMQFLENNKNKIDLYASLDKVIDGKESLKNYKIMLKNNFTPIPVYHDGEDYKIMDYYMDNSKYIGLGAVAYKSNKARLLFFNDIFKRYKTNFHGFGVFSINLFEQFPFKSVDSTTIAKHAISGDFYFPNFGWINLNMQQNKRMTKWRTKEGIKKVSNYVNNLGYTLEELCLFDQQSAIKRFILSVIYFNNKYENDNFKIKNKKNYHLF